jgi:outer membrane receptor protein involved in Fe transport
MKNLARTLAVILLSVTSAAWAADEPAPPVPAGETTSSAPVNAAPPSEAPDSLPPAPSIPSEAKTTAPAPAPKAPPAEPPVKTAVPTTKLPSVRELPAIVVTESKIAQPQESVTQSVRVLYAEDIAERPENQRNLSELLRYEPGVFILPLSRNDANWGSYGGQGPKYNVHLLDGLPVDSFVDDMSLDAWAFERVESHRGPASVMYSNYLTSDFAGNESPLAGVTNFVLRERADSRRFFSYIEPELAGEIGGSNMLVPSSTGAR